MAGFKDRKPLTLLPEANEMSTKINWPHYGTSGTFLEDVPELNVHSNHVVEGVDNIRNSSTVF